MALAGFDLRGSTFYFDLVRVTAILCDRPIAVLARGLSDENRKFMARDQGDDFHVRPGRVGSRGTRINPRVNLSSQPFLKQVQLAVRTAGGNPNRIGREPGPGAGRERGQSGRFNARGRGAKVVPLFLREGSSVTSSEAR